MPIGKEELQRDESLLDGLTPRAKGSSIMMRLSRKGEEYDPVAV